MKEGWLLEAKNQVNHGHKYINCTIKNFKCHLSNKVCGNIILSETLEPHIIIQQAISICFICLIRFCRKNTRMLNYDNQVNYFQEDQKEIILLSALYSLAFPFTTLKSMYESFFQHNELNE